MAKAARNHSISSCTDVAKFVKRVPIVRSVPRKKLLLIVEKPSTNSVYSPSFNLNLLSIPGIEFVYLSVEVKRL